MLWGGIMDTRQWEDGSPNPYHSLLDPPRIYLLEENAKTCERLLGAAVEVGVYHGGSLVRIANLLKDKIFYGIDTFEGMPEPCERDLHKKGNFADCDYGFMVDFFKTVLPRVNLIKGFFPSPAVMKRINHKIFCFVHVDVDLYQSTKDCLEYFVPRLVPGGILIVDDYGFATTPGAKQAVDEYVECLRANDFDFKALPTRQYRIKRIA